MEFLKEILGEELYAQVEAKINQHNGADANKDKQVKLANLSGGEYVGKGKYDSLNESLTAKQTELDTANNTIAELKKLGKGNEEMQATIAEYSSEVAKLKEQLDKAKLDYAVKTALQGANAVDADYLMFKLREGGEPLELDENGNIKGIDEKLTTLKTAYPAMFGQGGKDGYQILGDNKLPQSNHDSGMSKADLLKKPYAERAKFYAENPDAYKEIMK